MTSVLVGAVLLIVSIAVLRFSMPVRGQMRSFARHGNDVFIASAFTAGMGFGIAALLLGVMEATG